MLLPASVPRSGVVHARLGTTWTAHGRRPETLVSVTVRPGWVTASGGPAAAVVLRQDRKKSGKHPGRWSKEVGAHILPHSPHLITRSTNWEILSSASAPLGYKFSDAKNPYGVSDLLASLGHMGRRGVVLGHTLNTQTLMKTDEQRKGFK